MKYGHVEFVDKKLLLEFVWQFLLEFSIKILQKIHEYFKLI